MLHLGILEKAIKTFLVRKGTHNTHKHSRYYLMDRRSHHEMTYYDHGHVALWHYHLSSHQTRVVALGGMAKRKGVSSWANLLISMKCLWITLSPLVIKLGQWPSTIPLKHKRKRSKEIKLRIKGNEWARKQLHLWQGAAHPLQRHPQVRFTFSCYHMHPMPKHLPFTTSYTYVIWTRSHLGNTPNLWRISPIRHPETFSKPILLNCIMSLSICLGKGGFNAHVWVI